MNEIEHTDGDEQPAPAPHVHHWEVWYEDRQRNKTVWRCTVPGCGETRETTGVTDPD